MGKPIFRVIIKYGYRNKGSARQYKYKIIDTFVLTDDVELIKKDKDLHTRIKHQVGGKKKELELIFTSIRVEGQYGETAY